MKDRIIQVMEHEGLSSTRFAEEIGVNKGSISHITSGRNNPSLEIAKKILERYPYINSEWLIMGIGSMMKNISMSEPDLFSSAPIFTAKSTEVEKKEPVEASKPLQTEHKQPVIEDIKPIGKPSNKIAKIIIYYTDNTYETFTKDKTEP